ncbi:hypothetical protein BKD26_35830 [Streptomyces sp. CB03238]|nr:hypothetical protein BKD26_35830 [Streptomyces sp. CB03238]
MPPQRAACGARSHAPAEGSSGHAAQCGAARSAPRCWGWEEHRRETPGTQPGGRRAQLPPARPGRARPAR